MSTVINARIVADSICPRNHRITSMVLTFPRYILAEFNTHRMFSRNSASSRAIPFKKMMEMVKDDPFIPIKWMKDHKGMQGTELLDESDQHWSKETWIAASEYAIKCAESLNERYGLTKQMCNRLLEPFMWHTVLVTATEWDNFFMQRANKGAEIHMEMLAYKMLTAMNNSTPKEKKETEWHIPFEDTINDDDIVEIFCTEPQDPELTKEEFVTPYKIQIATALAARTSYTTITDTNKAPSYKNDLDLHGKLWAYPHPSPFEHCAQVPTLDEYLTNMHVKPMHNPAQKGWMVQEEGWFGNFHGWKQYRKTLPNENQDYDPRLTRYVTKARIQQEEEIEEPSRSEYFRRERLKDDRDSDDNKI